MTLRFGRNVIPSERRPVSWYSPPVLLQAGRELVSSVDFLRNSDRRELFRGPFDPIQFAAQADGSFGFDFIADTGDGGNATATLADAVLGAVLQADGAAQPLKRPPLVVLGGDLAYPGANSLDYHYRLLEPFALARPPKSSFDPRAAWDEVLAIPQNHDWFDSTTTFCRYFVQRTSLTEFVDARARQQRTYFAAMLPHRWWILGLDFALKGDIDREQYKAFRSLWDPDRQGPRIEAGDNVILVYPEPYWTRPLSHATPEGYTLRYQRLEHLLEAPSAPAEDKETHGAAAQIRLRLSGDLHHYCRHYTKHGTHADGSKRSTHLVTCGSGGAFLHTTHGSEVQRPKIIDRSPVEHTVVPSLARRIRVGLQDNTFKPAADHDTLGETKCYPGKALSRSLALKGLWWSIIGRPNFSRPDPSHTIKLSQRLAELWDSNVGFALCLGLLYGFNAYVNSIAFSASFEPDKFSPINQYSLNLHLIVDWVRANFFSPFAALVNLIMIAGCVRIAWEGLWGWPQKLLSGVAHGLVHGVAVCVIYYLCAKFAYGLVDAHVPANWGGLLRGPLTLLFVVVCGSVVGALIFGIYFAIVNGVFGQLTNNASGAIAVQDYKGFLRFRITAEKLEANFVACDKVSRRWKIEQDGSIAVDGESARWHIEDRFTLLR